MSTYLFSNCLILKINPIVVRKFLCLLIDDDDDDIEIFGMAIASINKNIFFKGISEPIKAVELLAQKKILPGLIFIDHNMPRMNGEQCLHEIIKLPHLMAVPKYIYSTSTNGKLNIGLVTMGAAGFITKPRSLIELTILLGNLFSSQKIEML